MEKAWTHKDMTNLLDAMSAALTGRIKLLSLDGESAYMVRIPAGALFPVMELVETYLKEKHERR